jgi:hypothetical protein
VLVQFPAPLPSSAAFEPPGTPFVIIKLCRIHLHQEPFMDEIPNITAGARRNEDIALDLMKFIAMTTGYGRTSASGVGFQGTGAASKPEDYAEHLLELYGKCLTAVAAKK